MTQVNQQKTLKNKTENAVPRKQGYMMNPKKIQLRYLAITSFNRSVPRLFSICKLWWSILRGDRCTVHYQRLRTHWECRRCDMLGRSRGIPPEKFWKLKYSWMQSSVIYMLKYFANARIPYWTKNNGRISNKML